MTKPRFSVIIPTYQRRELVIRNVAALEQQTYRDFEVIVTVDGSTDGTADALRRLRTDFPLVVLEQPNEGRAAALNHGVEAARGDLLLFLDDDMEADAAMLAEHRRSHAEGADMVLGHLPLHSESPETLLSRGVARWAERRRERLAPPGAAMPLADLLTGQMSIAKTTFEALGKFDVGFTRAGLFGGEDLDFGHRVERAGLRVVFNQAALSHQIWTVDPGTYLQRAREAGRSAEELNAKHPELARIPDPAREFNAWTSRLVFGPLALLPAGLSRPLRALVARRVRRGRMDRPTEQLFHVVRTVEYRRGARQARKSLRAHTATVLAYHAVADLREDRILSQYGVPPRQFAGQLDALLHRGRQFITLEAFLRALDGQPLPRGALLLTFDDAYADLVSAGLPILAERGLPAVVFTVAGQVGGTNEWDRGIGATSLPLLDAEGLRELANRGIAIGSHGMTHRRFTELGPELEKELVESADQLESLGLDRPVALAYPHGVWDAEVAEAVRDAGYKAAFTVAPGVVRRDSNRFALPRVEVLASDSARMLRLKLATAGWPDRVRRRVLRLARARL
jgi:peptidoglycan/xylan/chitin deacetylase (PgdA/CDA1 family)/GT2 family glycosyltransferase